MKGYCYPFPKADVTVDCVVFGLDMQDKKLKVLLIERGREGEPYFGYWALPGGFIEMDEHLGESAARELKEETGVTLSYLEQLYTFGAPGRDPRGRVVSVAYMGIVRPENVDVVAADDAAKAQWFPVDNLPDLAFDHKRILSMAVQRLRGKLRWQPVGVWLLPETFTLASLHEVYQVILGREIPLRTFRNRIKTHVDSGVLVMYNTGLHAQRGYGRPPFLYSFNNEAYKRLQREGLDFEV